MKKLVFIILVCLIVGVYGQDTVKKARYIIGITATPLVCYRSVSTQDSYMQWAVDERNHLEGMAAGFEGGVYFEKPLPKRFAVSVALHYAYLGFATNKIYYLQNDNPDIDFTKVSYRYHYLSIPINLTYHFGGRNRIFFVSVGFSPNLFLRNTQKHTYFDNLTKVYSEVRVNQVNANYFTCNLMGGFGCEGKFNQHLGYSVMPTIQYSLRSSVYADLQEHLWAFGISFNLMYYFYQE